jgi:YfiR/HmsC-like
MTARALRRARAWCAAMLCGAVALPVAAQGPSEYEVKGAFLLNFVKFVEWPAEAFESPQSPIVLCVAGRDPFDGRLHELVRGEQVGGRPLEVRLLPQPPAAPAGCHLLFVPAGGNNADRYFRASAGRPVLTVGDDSQALHQGCVIAFELDARRVRFAINPRAATDAGLRLSARLLQVARIVGQERR